MKSLIAYLRSFWRGVRRPAELDADMNDEMRFHIDMEAKRFMQRGLDAAEARRQAALAFGGVEKYRGASRDALGFTWLRGMSTDVRLGMRMLRKYPGLTCVALFALSLAISAGASYLEFANDLMRGRLPFRDADRIVGIQSWDQQTGDPENRQTFEFVRWRGALTSIDELGAYRALDRNLITSDGRSEPVRGVEISASAFRIAGVPPLHGRPLVADDERPAAAPVVVLGYDVWAARFGSDPSAIGQSVNLGHAAHTVVGVMPQGFGFPVAHSLWVPLKLGEADPARRAGPVVKVFGRLAGTTDLGSAQAELTAVAERTSREFPDTHQHVRPVVKLYVESLWSANGSGTQTIVLWAANIFFIGLLAVCGANIATLVFARTATREAEISIRTALGASRSRIAGQLFAEALVLSSIAAALGLTITVFAMGWVREVITAGQGNRMMFWWNDSLSPATVLYAGVLAILAALIVGVIPALKATGSHIQDRLKHVTGGSAASLKFGGVWTGVIVVQVGLTVIFLAVATTLGWGLYFRNAGDRALTFPAAEYVAMRVTMDREPSNTGADEVEEEARFRTLLRARYEEFARRLAAEPGVAGVAFAIRLPGTNLLEMRAEVDGIAAHAEPDGAPYVMTTSVGVGLMETFGAPIVSGRSFSEADLAPGRSVAIVDQTFVRHVLRGGDAIGRRVRARSHDGRPAGPWMEIVGVVRDFTAGADKEASDAVLYRPASADVASQLRMAVHVKGDTTNMMWRLRVIAAEVDPSLRLDELNTLDQVRVNDRIAIDFFMRLLAGIGIVGLVLATAGVYALLAFTVSRRTPEIGIRIALGASARGVVFATFGRALGQVVLGVVLGGVPAIALVASIAPEVAAGATTTTTATICAIAAGVMILASTAACYGPARRALRIQPTDALKDN